MIYVRQFLEDDHESVVEIAKALYPRWFNEVGLQQIARDLQTEQELVALEGERVVGFVIYRTDKNSKIAELDRRSTRASSKRHRTSTRERSRRDSPARRLPST